jgi:hypothetical protein
LSSRTDSLKPSDFINPGLEPKFSTDTKFTEDKEDSLLKQGKVEETSLSFNKRKIEEQPIEIKNPKKLKLNENDLSKDNFKSNIDIDDSLDID